MDGADSIKKRTKRLGRKMLHVSVDLNNRLQRSFGKAANQRVEVH